MEQDQNTELPVDIVETAQKVRYLGEFTVWFADVKRATYFTDRLENDVEHSYMLGLVAPYLAETYYPELDQSLVSQFCLVHDMSEAITGDVPTFNISEADRIAKDVDEAEVVGVLAGQMPQYWGELLRVYNKQESPEARFVRLVDKIMPPLVNIAGNGKRTLEETYRVTTKEELAPFRERMSKQYQKDFPEFPLIHQVRDEIVNLMNEVLFGDNEQSL